MLIGLWRNQDRIETRRAYLALRGVRDGLSAETPQGYFMAIYEDDDQAQAMYELHQSRMASYRND
jgi:uncharacterized protein YdbL (DUF1318 family)